MAKTDILREGPDDSVLWITRMDAEGENDDEVARIGYRGDGARRTFEHAARVAAEPGDLEPGDLIVTLLVKGGDDAADEDPLRIPAIRADWFLDTWLAVPADWRA